MTQTQEKLLTTHILLDGPESDLPEVIESYEDEWRNEQNPEVTINVEHLPDDSMVERRVEKTVSTSVRRTVLDHLPKGVQNRLSSYLPLTFFSLFLFSFKPNIYYIYDIYIFFRFHYTYAIILYLAGMFPIIDLYYNVKYSY